MSARRVLAGSAIALLMPASLLLTTEASSATESSTGDPAAATATSKAKGYRVSLEALPQIVQQGRGTASPDAARAAVTAKIKPSKVGRPIQLQVKTGRGWKKAGKVKQDGNGRAEFSARASGGGRSLTYRVKASKFKGLRPVTSGTVTTERWQTPHFTEEFSGQALGPEWSHRAQSNDEANKRYCSKGDPKAVRVSGGSVRLSVLKDSARKYKCQTRKNGKSTGRYAHRLNGHIGTANAVSFKYGFAAARVKMHKRLGQHSSFWLQPQVSAPGSPRNAGAEIDVIEYFGDKHPRGGLDNVIHWKRGTQAVKTGYSIKKPTSFLKNKRDGWSKNYHVFSVEWTPRMYIFRIDGKETWRTRAGVSGQPQFAILSLLSSDYELGRMKDKDLPQHMFVDWMRIWEA